MTREVLNYLTSDYSWISSRHAPCCLLRAELDHRRSLPPVSARKGERVASRGAVASAGGLAKVTRAAHAHADLRRSRVEDHGGQPPWSSAGCWAVVPAMWSEAMGQMGKSLGRDDMDLRREPVQGMRPRGAASGPCLVRSLASGPSVTRGEAARRRRFGGRILSAWRCGLDVSNGGRLWHRLRGRPVSESGRSCP